MMKTATAPTAATSLATIINFSKTAPIADDEGNRTFRYVDADGSDTLNSGDTDITEYEWDHRNRLTEVEDFTTYANYDTGTSDQIVDYTYDCFNRLISRTLDSDGTSGATAVEQSIYVNENGQIVAQFDKTGSGDLAATDMTHRYLWNPQAVDQLFSDEQIHYDSGFVTDDLLWALTDHQNSVRDGVTYDSANDSADLRIHRIFDAFGNKTDEDLFDEDGNAVTSGQAGALDELFEYTGKLYDEDTGLQNNWHRWYAAAQDWRIPGGRVLRRCRRGVFGFVGVWGKIVQRLV